MSHLFANLFSEVLHVVDRPMALNHTQLFDNALGVFAKNLDCLTSDVEPVKGSCLSQERLLISDGSYRGADMLIPLVNQLLVYVYETPARKADKVVTKALPVDSLHMLDELGEGR